MNNNTTEKKELFDENHGFRIMQKWPAIIRWLLVLPVALFSFILINGFSSWALKITSAEWFLYVVSFIFHTFAAGAFVYYGGATAPTARKIVMIILSVILMASAILIFTLQQENHQNYDLSPTLKIINLVSNIIGIIFAFVGANKKNETPK